MTKWFAKFVSREDISHHQLCKVVHDIALDRIDVHYGGGVFKQRMSRHAVGKSGGYRIISLYKPNNLLFFVYSFAKKDRNNIDDSEVITFKDMAQTFLNFSDAEIARLVNTNNLKEVMCHETSSNL